MNARFDLLAPKPQKLSPLEDQVSLPRSLTIRLAQDAQALLFSANWLKKNGHTFGIVSTITAASAGKAEITLDVDAAICPRPQSYRLVIGRDGVFITAGDAAGLFYGATTLWQLITMHAGDFGNIVLPAVQIEDWPDYPQRGVMFDVSRDRVPTMKTLYELVDLLASLKVNQLQLYTEHTFAYRGHEVVWKDAGPLTGEEVMLLDAYCRERHIELVPNQNSFGHMHRWLKHDAYRHLAESPEGIDHPFTPDKEPYSLCPIDPGSLDLLAGLYDQLLPHFSSRQFNVGLDETFDLGLGRSSEACAEKGTGRVYLEFLKKIHGLVTERGRTMQFWSDIIVRDEPELVSELPRDVIALEWGYEADYPFAENVALIAASGRSFYVCPGTSSWNTLSGRTDNALGNLANAATSGYEHGAVGYLNTDWGDNGHLQPLPVSFFGFLAGAYFSWNAASAQQPYAPDWPAMLDAHVFGDRAGVMGRIACDLGRVYLQAGDPLHNSSPLFWLLTLPDALPDHRQAAGMTIPRLEQTISYIDEVMEPMRWAQLRRADGELIRSEFEWVADTLAWVCALGVARLSVGLDKPVEEIGSATRAVLAEELGRLIERYRVLWTRRSRSGGLKDSVGRLTHMMERLSA